MFGDTAVYIVVRAINGLLALATVAVLTRLLDPAQYGSYALGMAAVGLLAAVAFQWLNAAVARFYAAHEGAADAFVTEAHVLFGWMAGVALAGGLAWMLIGSGQQVSTASTAIVVAAGLGLGVHNLHLQIVNARRQPLRYGMITASRGVAALALAIAAVLAGFGADGVLAAFAAACLLSVVLFGARWHWSARPASSDLRRRLASYGAPMALASSSIALLDVADRFFIAWWHGSAAVAGYAAARDFTQQTVGVLLHVFLMAGFPRVTAAWESAGVDAARPAMVPLARGLLLVGPLAVAAFAGMGPEIARLVFGIGVRAEAALVMPWIALAVAVGCVKAYFLDIPLQLGKATGALMRIALAMVALNVALNLALVPRFGSQGAAWSAVAAFAAGAAMSGWQGRRLDVCPPFAADVLKALGALLVAVLAFRWTAGMVEVPLSLRLVASLAGQALAGTAAYFATAWLLDLCRLRSEVLARGGPRSEAVS
jgi:O-antigen/teichoic acid export membrane protein